MPNVSIPIVGGSYQHRSLPLSSQVTRNWYPEFNQDSKSIISLLPTPGAKTFCTSANTGSDRGMHDFNGTLYKVSGTTLYRVNSIGVETSIGTISGSARCAFVNDATTMIIVTGGVVYSYNGTTLATETDLDFESPNTVAYLNNQAIYDGDNGRWSSSDAGSLTSINALNYANAESSGDALDRVYVFNQILYLMGLKTIEPWYNSGSGTPPFDRVEGGILQVGLGARWSVAHNDQFMYFLGDDRNIYRMTGTQATPVANPAIAYALQSYATVSDAIGMCCKWNGQNFYLLTFHAADKTWCYSESADMWFEMSSSLDGGRHLANSYIYIYGKHLIADHDSGDVYEWGFTTHTDNGSTIKRVRHSKPIDGSLFDPTVVGKPLFMGELEIIINAGTTTLLTGQGSNPDLMLRYSDDGGRTWSSYVHGTPGQIAQHTWKLKFGPLGRFYERIIEISATDPIAWEIYGARAEIEAGV